MRLLNLKLNNIKTYVNLDVDFNEGINCILGKNGGGKSTIIESIGFSLFGFNSKKKIESLIRYNEKEGSIILSFVGNDYKSYRVEKTLRRSGQNKARLYSIDDESLIAENVNNVTEAIKKILDIKSSMELSNLFEEIIAVPQGQFVNAFEMRAVDRRKKFDTLFGLEVYRKLYEEMKKVNDCIKDNHITPLTNEKSLLEGQLINYDEKLAEQATLNKTISEDEKVYNDTIIIYNKKQEEKQALDSLEKQDKELDTLIQTEQSNNQIILTNKQQKEKELNQANEAKDLLKQNEFGYNKYLVAIKELEKIKKQYETIQRQKATLLANTETLKGLNAQIDILDEAIKELKKDLGSNRDKLIKQTSAIDELKKKHSKDKDELIPLKELNKLKQAEEIQNKNGLFKKVNSVKEKLESFEKFNTSITPEDYQKDIDIIKEKLESIKKYNEEKNDKENLRTIISADLENLINNEKDMKDGLCPILKQKCLNLNGGSLDCKLTSLINEKRDKLSELNTRINELNSLVKDEDNLNREKESKLILQNSLKMNFDRYYELIDAIKNEFSEASMITKDNAVEIMKELYLKYNELYNTENTALTESLNKERLLQETYNNDEAQIKFEMGQLPTYQKEIDKITSQITKHSEKINEYKEKISKIESENTKINLELAKNPNIDIEIQDLESTKEKFEPVYLCYIANEKEASKLDDINKDLLTLEGNLIKSNELIEKLKQEKKELESKFSVEQLNELNIKINELSGILREVKTKLDLNKESLVKLEKDISILDERKEEKEKIEKTIDKYISLRDRFERYRKIYADLPQVLSAQIRKFIAKVASDYYNMISLEKERIEIDDSYGVKIVNLNDQTKERYLEQLSGGEKMSVAIAIRLAMLKKITNIDIYFMDEPTVNLDTDRRVEVAQVVKGVASSLKQLFVISHDDTFAEITDSTIKINKNGDVSELVI